MMKKKKQAGPRTAPPSLKNKDECGAAVDTDLFMNRWILLMKSGEVKTLKQNYLVFYTTPPIRLNFPGATPPGPLFFIFSFLDTQLLDQAHVL
jgi:hypothetical protein